jgi:hypothetical protein
MISPGVAHFLSLLIVLTKNSWASGTFSRTRNFATSPISPSERSALVPQPCPHCDQPDTSLLRLVLMGEILRADETLLALLADVLQ